MGIVCDIIGNGRSLCLETRKGAKLQIVDLDVMLDRRRNAFSEEDVDFLRQVAGQVAIALENALEFSELSESKDRLAEEGLYLRDEIRTFGGHDGRIHFHFIPLKGYGKVRRVRYHDRRLRHRSHHPPA